jgi:putative ABC transport system permease protein
VKKSSEDGFKIPRIANWIMRKTISRKIRNGVLGDFEEIYFEIVKEKGLFQGRLWYWGQAIKSLPSFLYDSLYWRMDMLKNYFRITLRNIQKNKMHYFINITGLSVGLAVFVFIASYVLNEVNHDEQHENKDRIYQVGTGGHNGSPGPMAELLKSQFPEILNTVRFRYNYGAKHVLYNKKNYKIERSYFVDPSIFDVFSFPVLRGNLETALDSPLSVVLTKSEAEKIFASEDPIEKVLSIEGQDLMVTAVIEDVPANSTIQFHSLISFKTLEQISPNIVNNWGSFLFQTYFLLPESHDAAEIESRLAQFMHSRYAGYDTWPQSRKDQVKFSLRPFKSLYFDMDRGGAMLHGNIQNVYIFTAVALFVLFIAIINFINLSTATASVRGREVGMRKVMGSTRGQVLRQFLAESVFLILGSSILAFVIVGLLKERFFHLIGKSVDFGYAFDPLILVLFVFSAVVIGLISGIYPAIYLSSFQPAKVLQGRIDKGHRGGVFRKALIVVQFTISIVLITGAFIVGNQLDFVRKRDLGFDKSQILWFEASRALRGKADVLKAKLRENANIENVATSNFTKPGVRSMWGRMWRDRQMDIDVFLVDPDYIATMGLEIVEGRNFLREGDRNRACILNESAVREFGMESPVGELVSRHTVVGVVKDFHFRSLHHEIGPLLLVYEQDAYPVVNVRISTENISQIITGIRRTYGELAPGAPFEYHFFDESFEALYQREQKFENLFLFFSAFAIFIACLGLFGLASFMAGQRTKEIGIRKVLGASTGNVVLLLSREFTKWVILANIVAWPVAYLAMNRWLSNFAYRIKIGAWVFLAAGLIALTIALLTVSSKAIKAALSNPADSLRYE